MTQPLISTPEPISPEPPKVAAAPPPRAALPTTINHTQLLGLRKVGDLMIPGDADMPRFSASGCAEQADRMIGYMNKSDRDGVTMLLTVFRFTPRLAIRGLLALMDRHASFPEPIAGALRLLNFGVKGVVMTLYYSGLDARGEILAGIGWDTHVSGAPLAEDAPLPPQVSTAIKPQPVFTGPTAAEAMARARNGSAALRRTSLADRLRYLDALRVAILRRREEIVTRIQQDTGKGRADALISEIFGVLDNLAWLQSHAGKALADHKQHTPLALMGKSSQTWYEPLGTILIISPWNYPFYQAIVPIACALAAGNTVVYKPSEHTPLTGLVEDLLAEAQLPPNWVQVAYGDGAVGAALVAEKPDKIFFTGSTRTGKRIMAQAAEHLIPVELELGGKDAMIVFADANLTRAAAGAAWGGLTTTGQSCTSVERIYVERPIYDAFRGELVRQVKVLVQRVDEDGDADLGAMTTDFQVKIVADQVTAAKAQGAAFLTGAEWDGQSRLIPPMVVDRVSDDMAIAREETFGPLLPLLPFDREDEVVQRANDSVYGLTASVWSKDLTRARRVARALHVGGVSINNVMATEANPALPFGGVKQSGFGRYKGDHGLQAFCNVKSVLIDKDSAKIEANWYPYTTEKYRLFNNLIDALFGTTGVKRLVKFALAGLKLESYSGKAAKSSTQRRRGTEKE
jgi:acyl-CoA reductase-like NAD-dependent aldehyde dehydrogenase